MFVYNRKIFLPTYFHINIINISSSLFLNLNHILMLCHPRYLNLLISNDLLILRQRIISCIQIFFQNAISKLQLPLNLSFLLLQLVQFFLHFHMPYLIFPVLLFILYTAFPARAFSVYLLLPVLNLLNLFFLLIYEIHKIHNTFDVIIYNQQIFVL